MNYNLCWYYFCVWSSVIRGDNLNNWGGDRGLWGLYVMALSTGVSLRWRAPINEYPHPLGPYTHPSTQRRHHPIHDDHWPQTVLKQYYLYYNYYKNKILHPPISPNFGPLTPPPFSPKTRGPYPKTKGPKLFWKKMWKKIYFLFFIDWKCKQRN